MTPILYPILFFWNLLWNCLVSPLLRLISWQMTVFFDYLDPISRERFSFENVSKPGNAYALSGFFMLLGVLYGNLLLPYLSGVPLTWSAISTTPALLFRQIFPRVMWPQTDFVFIIGTSGSVLLYALFWARPWTINRYVICGRQGRKCLRIGKVQLSQENSRKMIHSNGRIKRVAFISLAFLFPSTMLFLYVNLYLNSFYGWSAILTLVYLFILPGFIFYAEYVLFILGVFLLLASNLFQIQQKTVLSDLRGINARFLQVSRRGSARERHFTLLKQANTRINEKVLEFCGNIADYSTFWRPSLTLLFLHHITFQTYLLYTIFLIKGVPFPQKIIFFYLVLNINLTLFALISFCGKVVKLNRAIELANQSFYHLCLVKIGFRKLKLSYQLKLEALATSGRLRPYAFHLFDNYRITSRTFYLVLSDISLFFMLYLEKFRKF